MKQVRLIQIGAGGSGNWFSRNLSHALADAFGRDMINQKDNINLQWEIIDPDTVELKNMVRQAFYSAEDLGKLKADIVSWQVKATLGAASEYFSVNIPANINITAKGSLVEENTIDSLLDLEQDPKEQLVIVASFVDNSYTRNLLENYMQKISTQPYEVVYIDSGNDDKSFIVTSAIAREVPKVKYDVINLPDPMLSCAVREETTNIPQTTTYNMLVGVHSSSIVMDILSIFRNDEQEEVNMNVAKQIYLGADKEVKHFTVNNNYYTVLRSFAS